MIDKLINIQIMIKERLPTASRKFCILADFNIIQSFLYECIYQNSIVYVQ